VIGGSDIFAATMPMADRLEITHVNASPDGGAVFPPIYDEIWQELSSEKHFGGPADDAEFSFGTYIRGLISVNARHDGALSRRLRSPITLPTTGASDVGPAQETFSMPWNNQGGGGPWGSGGRGPWGSGPQSPGPTPPDLEEILRRGQDRLRRVLPG